MDEELSVRDCEQCPALVDSRSRIVDGVGPTDAEVCLVGEAPGEHEDSEGEPFVGRSGDVLDETLAAAGLDRSDIRIANCVRCRPPDNRDPTSEELSNCEGYLARELDAVEPSVVVALGKVPAQHLLGRDVAVTKEAGSVAESRLGDSPHRVVVSVHPAAPLYDPSQRERLDDAMATAADLADTGDGGGQVRLDEY